MNLLFLLFFSLFIALTWHDIKLGILLICALLPSYLVRLTIASVPTTLLELMVLVVVSVWFFQNKQRISFKKLLKLPILLQITLLLLASIIGIVVSPDKHAAIGIWKAYYIEPMLFAFVLFDLLKQKMVTMEKIFFMLGISAMSVSLFGIIQFLFNLGIPSPWDLERRITSYFDYPNAVGLFLEPIIVLSWFQIERIIKETKRNQKKPKAFVFWILVSILSLGNVFLAQSEAGLAALFVTALFYLILSKATRKQTLIFIMIGTALIFAIPQTRAYLIQKFTFQDWSEQVRLSQWKESIDLLKDHPLFGVGLSGYPIVMQKYHQNLAFEIFQYPHNILMNILAELGLMGLLAFFMALYQLIKITIKEKFQTPFLLYFLLFFEICLHGFVDVPYFKNDLSLLVWILIACAMYTKKTQQHLQ